jgi:hypothetical protein
MSLKNASDNLDAAFAEAEAKLDKVAEKVDASIAQVDATAVTGESKSPEVYRYWPNILLFFSLIE